MWASAPMRVFGNCATNCNLPHLFELCNNFLEVWRQIREYQNGPSVPGVPEAELAGVETLGALPQLRLFVAVDQIAQNGVADVGHVDPDLVGPSRLQTAADMGVAPVALHHFPVGHGFFGVAGGDGHLLPVGGVPADGGVDGAGVLPEGAADDGFVGPRHGVVLELGGQHGVGQIVFGDSQQSAGVLVDAVDDAGPQLAVDAGEVIAHGVQQAVDQGIVLMTDGRVDHQALGLVDHHHILVLIDDVQGNVLGHDVHRFGLRNGDLNGVAGIQFVIFLAGLAVSRHGALIHELLGGGAGQVRADTGHEGVQPLAGNVSGKNHFFSSFQNSLLNRIRETIMAMQPQVMKQSATLNTGNTMNFVSIISTT